MKFNTYQAIINGFCALLIMFLIAIAFTSCSTTSGSRIYYSQEEMSARLDWQKLYFVMDTCNTCVLTQNYTMNFTCVVDTADDDWIIHIAPGLNARN